MRLADRSDLSLVIALGVAMYVGLSNRIEHVLEQTFVARRNGELQLRAALVILAGTFIFHLLHKRHQMRAVAHTAATRIEEMERLVAFGHAIAKSLELDTLRATVRDHLSAVLPGRRIWIASDVLELPVPPAAAESDLRVPMTVAGSTVGVLGVDNEPPLSEREQGLIVTAAALLGVSIKNAELFRETHENSIRDPLTGCFRRPHALATIDMELRRARRTGLPMALMMFDVDHFKEVNDRYGHPCGDAVLASVGHRLTALLRISDVKCRYGGEEFLVFLPESTLTGAYRAADAIRRSFEQTPVVWNDTVIPVTASFGLTTVRPGERDVDAIIARADAALYRSKEAGRNCVSVEQAAALA